MKIFLWTVISGFGRFPEFRGTINDSFSANTYQHSTSYKEISVPMTCLDCKSELGNVVNRANPKDDSLGFVGGGGGGGGANRYIFFCSRESQKDKRTGQ